MKLTAGLDTKTREGRSPFHQASSPSLRAVCTKQSENATNEHQGFMHVKNGLILFKFFTAITHQTQTHLVKSSPAF